LAGFETVAETDDNLVEWNYGQYEGLTTAQIRAQRPDWDLFRNGCPGGELPEQVSARANSVVTHARALQSDVLVFSSGHFLRVLAARWLGLGADGARYVWLSTASLSALSYELNLSSPVIELWNDTSHLDNSAGAGAGSKGTALQTSRP
jgi:probable phosphoglycerate mutase